MPCRHMRQWCNVSRLNMTLGGGEWLGSRSRRFTPGDITSGNLGQEVEWSQTFWKLWRTKNLFPPSGMEPSLRALSLERTFSCVLKYLRNNCLTLEGCEWKRKNFNYTNWMCCYIKRKKYYLQDYHSHCRSYGCEPWSFTLRQNRDCGYLRMCTGEYLDRSQTNGRRMEKTA
jgi:hypothetical protein